MVNNNWSNTSVFFYCIKTHSLDFLKKYVKILGRPRLLLITLNSLKPTQEIRDYLNDQRFLIL